MHRLLYYAQIAQIAQNAQNAVVHQFEKANQKNCNHEKTQNHTKIRIFSLFRAISCCFVVKNSSKGAFQTSSSSQKDYSYRRQSIGSRREAFLAGRTPNIRPTPIETDSPAITAQAGTCAGMLGINSIIRLLMPIATTVPMMPPKNVSVIASSRN